MAEDLSSLILRLSTYHPVGPNARPKALNFVQDYPRFISTLIKINQMIGLAKVKQQVAIQVKSFIVNYRRYHKPMNGEKLHTLLYGMPGCGKTQLGKYLAELWAVSGCLPRPKTQSVTHPPLQISSIVKPIKTTDQNLLRQSLNIRETQLKQTQDKLRTIEAKARETLTLYNNVRKKVQAKNNQQSGHIQSKFQDIKARLREMAGSSTPPVSSSGSINSVGILPVIVPRQPGARSVFGNHIPPIPFLPQSLQETSFHRNIIVPPKTSLPGPAPNVDSNVGPNPSPENLSGVESEPATPFEVKFGVITRGDLIAKFQGHTTEKVREIFDRYDGGVVFIDEAYNLCTSDQDDFGKEILTEINNYMSSHPDRIIFIFAGYRFDMENVVMKVQPGLARRFNWTFEIEKYTPNEIGQIFRQQLGRDGWDIQQDQTELIERFFKEHQTKFPHFGGDTERLCRFVTETCNEQHLDSALNDQMSEQDYQELFQKVSFNFIETAFQKYLENSVAHQSEESKRKEQREFINSTSLYI